MIPASTKASQIKRLHHRLSSSFRLTELAVRLAQAGTTYQIYQPASFDPLLDAAADDPEQNMPYWAVVWPSGVALADVVLTEREHFTGQRVIELGCGLGITATAALAVGAELTVTDYAPESLLLCRLNTLRNANQEPKTLRLNWRRPSAALLRLASPPFPIILAADVLYEARDVEPLLALVDRLLARDGTLWLAEPGRDASRRFVEVATAHGWRDEARQHAGPWPDGSDAGIIVRVHRLRRAN